MARTEPTRLITKPEKTAMQQKLKELGYYSDAVDGLWGKNSVEALSVWQQHYGYKPDDGIPTYAQMVALGATVPEVIHTTKPRASSPAGGVVLNLLLNYALPFLLNSVLPRSLMNNPFLLAIARVNKAWVAGAVSFLAATFLLFGIKIEPDTQGIIITVATALITAIATWAVPNAPKASDASGS